MKLSAKGRYALRLMLDIAANQDTDHPVSIKDVATRQGISEKYLEQIISLLNKAGLVQSLRGAAGGYRLNKPANEITVGMILRLTEGELTPVNCVGGEQEGACVKTDCCATMKVLQNIYGAINTAIDGMTVEDMVSWQRSMEEKVGRE